MKKIFESVRMNRLELKNRLVRSATWEGIALPDGSITEEAFEIYRELAKGGVGAVITGFTSVALHDYYFDGMMRLCDDALIHQYRKLTETSPRLKKSHTAVPCWWELMTISPEVVLPDSSGT